MRGLDREKADMVLIRWFGLGTHIRGKALDDLEGCVAVDPPIAEMRRLRDAFDVQRDQIGRIRRLCQLAKRNAFPDVIYVDDVNRVLDIKTKKERKS